MDIQSPNNSTHEDKYTSSDPDAEKSKEYWSQVEPTVNGMLGGFSRIQGIDIDGSKKFLEHFFIARKNNGRNTTEESMH